MNSKRNAITGACLFVSAQKGAPAETIIPCTRIATPSLRSQPQLLVVGNPRHVYRAGIPADRALLHVQQEVVDRRAVELSLQPDLGVVDREHPDDVDLAIDQLVLPALGGMEILDRKSTRLNSSH